MSYLPAGLEPQNLECRGDDHPLFLVIRWWDTLEGLEPLHGFLALLALVWDHSPHGAPKDLGWGTEVERSA